MAATYKEPTFKEVTPYKSQYGNAINKLTNAVVNRQAFSYDPNTDASYQSLAKQYQRLGDRARQDTLGNVAANTGGYASTAAVSAAQQAQNDYNIQLSNMIPQLMQAAYDRYQGEYNMNLGALNAVAARDDAMYGRWNDNRNYRRDVYEADRTFGRNVFESNRDYNRGVLESDRAYNYQKLRDKVADQQWNKTFNRNVYESNRDYNYQRGRDSVADAQWNKTFNRNVFESNRDYNFNKSVSDRDYAYQLARDKVADTQWAKGYALDERGVKLDEDKFKWSKQQGNSGSGGGSGRSGGGRSYSGGSGGGSSSGNSNGSTQKQSNQTVSKVGETTSRTSDSLQKSKASVQRYNVTKGLVGGKLYDTTDVLARNRKLKVKPMTK